MRTTKSYAIGYIRVSTSGQATEGVSLDAQRSKIEAWAISNGYELLTIHSDAGISGGKADNRPGLQSALADACQHKGALVVYSLSRLARSTKDAITISERLDKAGADLVSLTERIDTTNAAGKMIFRMMAVLSEFEKDLISERTSSALQHLSRVQKKRVGEIRFGYALAVDGENLTPLVAEQAVITKIKVLRERKKLSFSTIGRLLTLLKIPTKQGQPGAKWWPHVVESIYSANC